MEQVPEKTVFYKKKRRWPWILLTIFILLIGSAITFAFFVNYALNKPAGTNNQEKIFTIGAGSGIQKIAVDLEDQNLINYSWLFVGYARYKNLSDKMQVGQYGLRSTMTIPEITDILSAGQIKENQVTFPEGFTISQMTERLEEQNIIKASDFKKATKKYYPFEFLNDRPKEQNLEGFLFPDTYKFSLDVVADDIVEKMLLNFDQKLTSKMRKDIKEKTNTNIYEIITMASIIEKEASSDKDRKIIAGIFYKRWNEGKPLQSCATLQFILKTNKRRFNYKDTQTESSYNTYLHKELPPGPICNPGLGAIKAAIYPKKTDYLYFLSTKDGETIYAETYEEQTANEKKYLE